MVYQDGSTYIGQWINNEPCGAGEYLNSKGESTIGKFRNGSLESEESQDILSNIFDWMAVIECQFLVVDRLYQHFQANLSDLEQEYLYKLLLQQPMPKVQVILENHYQGVFKFFSES